VGFGCIALEEENNYSFVILERQWNVCFTYKIISNLIWKQD
jgi:hypothetical protein